MERTKACRNYTKEMRRRAVETCLALGGCLSDAIRELGYPNRHALARWMAAYERGELDELKGVGRPRKYSDDQKRAAVEHYLSHGRSAARTMRELGYPGRELLNSWIDELAPGERPTRPRAAPAPPRERAACVLALEAARSEGVPASEVERETGHKRATIYHWRDELLSDREVDDAMADIPEELPQDPEELLAYVEGLRERAEGLKDRVRRLELRCDVLEGTARILGKGGAGPEGLTSAEMAELVDSLRPAHALKDILAELGWNRSSYHYQRGRREAPDRHAGLRPAVRAAFEEGRGAYGYRRVHAVLRRDGVRVSEKVVRRVMAEEGLVARTSKKRRRFSTYAGETAPAPANLVARDFHADAPNRLWLSDFTEFRIPAGRVYLSPVLDCFCGELASWSISTRPDAELAGTSLERACAGLAEGERPVTHTDRGAPYRWPRWLGVCEEHGLVRSMSAKGCSPDNAACEGLFGRLKVEFFHGRDWSDVGLGDFMDELDGYLRWYNEGRIKASLGYVSPTQYRLAWERERAESDCCELVTS